MSPQAQRRVGLRVTYQLPGDGCGFAHVCDDLDARVFEPVTQRRPQIARVVARLKDVFEKYRADLDQALLDARGDLWRRVERVLQEVFEIPAQVFVVLRREVEVKAR